MGTGGQGLVTLISVINEAAFIAGYDVKSAEMRGLSQRGGSVETNIRFGKKVFSPMVQNGKADLILGLEMIEGLRAFSRSGEGAKFLVNKYLLPFEGSPKEEEVMEKLGKIKKDNFYLVPASEICKKEFNNEIVSTTYLLGYAVSKKLLPLKAEDILKAIRKVINPKYLELNEKAFKLAQNG